MFIENLYAVLAVTLGVPTFAFLIGIGPIIHSMRRSVDEGELPRAVFFATVVVVCAVVCGCACGLMFYYTAKMVLAGEL